MADEAHSPGAADVPSAELPAGAAAPAEAFREAVGEERRRARSLLNTRRDDDVKFFVAVTPQPVERIVAAASWIVPELADAALDARFDWIVIPGWRRVDFSAEFLRRLARHLLGRGCRSLRAMRLIRDESHEADAFRAAGFEVIARHEHFKLGYQGARPRHQRIDNRLQRRPALPAGWTIQSLVAANGGAAANLIAQHRLLAADRFWEGLSQGTWQEFSALLMHRGAAEAILLASASAADEVSIHVLAANRREGAPTALACNALFAALRQRCDAAGVASIYFWAEPDRSPATRRLALRFGGHVVGQTVQFGQGVPR